MAWLWSSAHLSRAADPDWPMWGGTPGRNQVAPDAHDLPSEFEPGKGKGVRWSAELGSNAYGNPVVAAGRVLVGTNNDHPRRPERKGDRGVMLCLRAADGELVWQDDYEKLREGNEQDWELQGICSSPAVDGDRAYYLTNRGELVCADLAGFDDGENDGPTVDEPEPQSPAADVCWRFDLRRELGVVPRYMSASSPLVVGARVFVMTSNGADEPPAPAHAAAPSVAAFDKQTGKLLWAEASAAGASHQVRTAAVLDGQWGSVGFGRLSTGGDGAEQLYVPCGDGWLYALAPETGRLLWKFDCNPPGTRWDSSGRGDRNYLLATPVFDQDRVYIATGQDPEHGSGPGRLVAIDARGVGDVSATHAAWSAQGKAFGRSLSTVAVSGEMVFAAELDGFLHGFDRHTGKELWRYDALSSVWGSPLVANGKVFLADEDGDLAVLEAGPRLKVLGESNLGDAVYGTPVAVGGTLFIATKSRLWALGGNAQP